MTELKIYLKPLTDKNAQLVTRGIVNKGFSGMRRFVTRFNFSYTLIGNRPQSLTNHTANRCGAFTETKNHCEVENSKSKFDYI